MILKSVTGLMAIATIAFLLSNGVRLSSAIPFLQQTTDFPSISDLPVMALLNPSVECSHLPPLLAE